MHSEGGSSAELGEQMEHTQHTCCAAALFAEGCFKGQEEQHLSTEAVPALYTDCRVWVLSWKPDTCDFTRNRDTISLVPISLALERTLAIMGTLDTLLHWISAKLIGIMLWKDFCQLEKKNVLRHICYIGTSGIVFISGNNLIFFFPRLLPQSFQDPEFPFVTSPPSEMTS